MGDMSHCVFHHARDARWHCGRCRLRFCAECIRNGHLLNCEHVCPVCGRVLELLGGPQRLSSLAAYLPRALRYPLEVCANEYGVLWLALVVMLGIASVLLGRTLGLPIPPFFFALVHALLTVVVYAMLYYLGYLVMLVSSAGYLHGAHVFAIEGRRSTGAFLRFMFLYVMASMLAGAVFHGSLSFASLLLLLMLHAWLYPALIFVARGSSLLQAFNPFAHVRLLRVLGSEFLLLLFLTTLGGVLAMGLYAWLKAHVLWFADPLGVMLKGYVLIVGAHMAGYLVYRHDALGFGVKIDASHGNRQHITTKQLPEKLMLQQSMALMKQGRVDDAWKLTDRYCHHVSSPRLHMQRLRILLEMGDPRNIAEHAGLSLAALLRSHDMAESLGALLSKLLRLLPEYCPDPELTCQMIHWARSHRQQALAQALCSRFLEHYPDHTLRAEISAICSDA